MDSGQLQLKSRSIHYVQRARKNQSQVNTQKIVPLDDVNIFIHLYTKKKDGNTRKATGTFPKEQSFNKRTQQKNKKSVK